MVVVSLPVGKEDQLEGLIDLVAMKEIVYNDQDKGSTYEVRDIREGLLEEAKLYREAMLEALAEVNDGIAEKFLEGKDIPMDEVKQAIRKATVGVQIFPALGGSAFKNKGVQFLLDCVVDYLPSPLDVPPIEGYLLNGGEEEKVSRSASDDEPFSALSFKIMTDPYVGRLSFVRIYSGTLDKGSYIYNASTQTKERVGRILRMHANNREQVDSAYAGDIIACVGLKAVTGDTLCAETNPIELERMVFPEPVIQVAIEPKTKQDQEKMGIALQKLMEEDPTFKLETDVETNQTLISGMGELHLEVIVDRLLREFKVEANVGKPQVAYKEAIRVEGIER